MIALMLDDAKLSARVTADVLQHADPAMPQRKYMRRGKVHHNAAAVINEAVMEGLLSTEQDQHADRRAATYRQFIYKSEL
ncbi:hypothetical protein [Nocardia sp. CA-120079]|uniref:hypothetical protein n=1 Tax=Nocardia sp. CA-120079 TaxID=3239974 RepID=UPI003D97300D